MADIEHELKAGLSPAEADVLQSALEAAAGSGARKLLITRYFDTPERTLAQMGAAVRIRTDGRRGTMTVKIGDPALGGYRVAREISRSWTRSRPDLAAIPDSGVRSALEAATAGATLVPWFTTRVERTVWRLTEPLGEVEVAIDRGRISAGRQRAPLCEVEFELFGGSPEALFRLAERLLGSTAAWLTLPGKAERGAALSSGRRILPELAPGRPPSIAGLETDAAVSRLLGWLAGQVATALHLALTDDGEAGPHQLRVALRRLRAMVRLMRPCLRKVVARALWQHARDIGRIVSPLRDADVLVPMFLAAARSEFEPQQARWISGELDRFHAALRADVRQQLRETGATGFAVRLMSLASLGGWQARHPPAKWASEVACSRLDRQWRRIGPCGDRLAILDTEDRHDLRKRLKIFRYGYEFSIENSWSPEFLSALKKLQADLGRLNDADVRASWRPPGVSAAVADALERLGVALQRGKGRQASDLALGRAARHWAELRGVPPPWCSSARPPHAGLAARNR